MSALGEFAIIDNFIAEHCCVYIHKDDYIGGKAGVIDPDPNPPTQTKLIESQQMEDLRA